MRSTVRILTRSVSALTALILLISAVQARAAALTRPASQQGPTRVTVAVYIADVNEINSAGQNFTAIVHTEYRWLDESKERFEAQEESDRRSVDLRLAPSPHVIFPPHT